MALRNLAPVRAVTSWFTTTRPAELSAVLLLLCVALGLLIFLLATGSDWRNAWPDDLKHWEKPKLEVLIQTGLWWGGLTSLSICLLLLVFSRWWLLRLQSPGMLKLPSVSMITFWVPLLLAIIVAGGLSWQRLGVSLNGDELYNLRRYIMGSYKLDEQQQPVFKATDWQDAWFENRGADNHIPYSLAARTSLKAWQLMAGSDDKHFKELALRLPAWMAGIAAIAGLAVFLWVAGFPRAGLIAAWLAAVHPWWLRYATEATGYSLAALWIPLTCATALLALRSGRWRWWLAWAACQFLLLLSVSDTLVFIVLLNLGLAITLLMRWRLSANPLPLQFRRYLAGLGISLVPLALLLGASTYQIIRYLVVDRVAQPMGWPWLQDAWGYLATGMPWNGANYNSPLIITFESLAGWPPAWLVASLMLLLAILGAHRLATSQRTGAVACAAALLLSGPLVYALASDNEFFLLKRYLFFYLPGVLAFVALAVDGSTVLLGKLQVPKMGTLALPFVFVAVFAWVTQPQRQIVLNHPKENLQAVASAIHGDRDPQLVSSSEVLRGHVWSSVSHYDPWSRNTPFESDLLALMHEAIASNVPMYYSFGYRARAMTEAPVKAAVELAENPLLFEHIDTYYGLEQDQFTHRLFKFRGQAAAPHIPPQTIAPTP